MLLEHSEMGSPRNKALAFSDIYSFGRGLTSSGNGWNLLFCKPRRISWINVCRCSSDSNSSVRVREICNGLGAPKFERNRGLSSASWYGSVEFCFINILLYLNMICWSSRRISGVGRHSQIYKGAAKKESCSYLAVRIFASSARCGTSIKLTPGLQADQCNLLFVFWLSWLAQFVFQLLCHFRCRNHCYCCCC